MPDSQQTINTAASLAALGKYSEAVEILDEMPGGGADEVDALLLKARIAAQQDRIDEAESICRQIDQLAPDAATSSEVARIRRVLGVAKDRNPLGRHQGKLIAAMAIAIVCAVGVAAFLVGHRSGSNDTRTQFIRDLGQKQMDLDADVQRQDHELRELVRTTGEIRDSLSRIEGQRGQGQKTLDRRIQQINQRLKSMEDQINNAVNTHPPK